MRGLGNNSIGMTILAVVLTGCATAPTIVPGTPAYTPVMLAPGQSGPPCRATSHYPDLAGYKPNAPVRSSVGHGHVLRGVVKSSADCSPFAGVRMEFWLANPADYFDDGHRATVITENSGAYTFESNF